MKNELSSACWLLCLVVGGLAALSFLPPLSWEGQPLRKVDLLADIRPTVEEPKVWSDSDSIALPPPVKSAFVDTCRTGLTCIEDYADSTARGMQPFYAALSRFQELDRPVRIAYFGDSFIEADILTADLRARLQERFGGCGVGYVPITSPIHGFRPTVRHRFEGWESHACTDSIGFDRKLQGIAGSYFRPQAGAFVELKGQTKYASRLDTCEVSILYFENEGGGAVRSTVNGSREGSLFELEPADRLQTLAVEGRIGQVRWTVEQADSARFYGVALEGRRGISLDNFSVRGSSGLHLRHIPLATLQAFGRVRPYDLIVLQFGLNVATERGTDYNFYQKGMLAVIEHLKQAFPDAGILLVSVGDRESKNNEGELRTLPGVRNLIRYQQAIAAEGAVAFWNLYEGMGGPGSMVEMVDRKQANLDYTHINFKGGSHLAGLLFETLEYGLENYQKRKAYEAE